MADAIKRDELLVHSYVIVETTALVQRRLGAEAACDLHDRLLRPFSVVWIDEATHRAAISACSPVDQ